jgi:hypothetical protein
MIFVRHNELRNSIDILMDVKSVDLLVEKLQNLETDGGHLHLYLRGDDRGLSRKDPYALIRTKIMNLLPTDAWGNTLLTPL